MNCGTLLDQNRLYYIHWGRIWKGGGGSGEFNRIWKYIPYVCYCDTGRFYCHLQGKTEEEQLVSAVQAIQAQGFRQGVQNHEFLRIYKRIDLALLGIHYLWYVEWCKLRKNTVLLSTGLFWCGMPLKLMQEIEIFRVATMYGLYGMYCPYIVLILKNPYKSVHIFFYKSIHFNKIS